MGFYRALLYYMVVWDIKGDTKSLDYSAHESLGML